MEKKKSAYQGLYGVGDQKKKKVGKHNHRPTDISKSRRPYAGCVSLPGEE